MAENFDLIRSIGSRLNKLFALVANAMDEPYRSQTESFISVGEYPLALDNIASSLLRRPSCVTPEINGLVQHLIDDMDLLSDPEYHCAAEWRARFGERG